jgi:hypothetical protein
MTNHLAVAQPKLIFLFLNFRPRPQIQKRLIETLIEKLKEQRDVTTSKLGPENIHKG